MTAEALTAYHIYMGIWGALSVGIGIGWAVGGLTPFRHGWTPLAMLAFWIAAGVGIANIPPCWLLTCPVTP